jgi:hypothetical protein
MNSIYKDKYLKYKNKYLQLKNQIGGDNEADDKLTRTLNHILETFFKPDLLTEPIDKNVELFTLAIGNGPSESHYFNDIENTVIASRDKFFKNPEYNKKAFEDDKILYRNILCFDKYGFGDESYIDNSESGMRVYLSNNFTLQSSHLDDPVYYTHYLYKNTETKMKIAFIKKFFPSNGPKLEHAYYYPDVRESCELEHEFYRSFLNYLKNRDDKGYTTYFSVYHKAHSDMRNTGGLSFMRPSGEIHTPYWLSGNAHLEKNCEIVKISDELTNTNQDIYVEILKDITLPVSKLR